MEELNNIPNSGDIQNIIHEKLENVLTICDIQNIINKLNHGCDMANNTP